MKTADLRAKTEDQLKEEIMSLRKEQFNFRFQKSTGQLENVSRIRAVRRDIARIKTVIAEQKQGKVPTAKAAAPKKAKPAAKEKAAESAAKKKAKE
jgi:large subunit ribosomal protein L29